MYFKFKFCIIRTQHTRRLSMFYYNTQLYRALLLGKVINKLTGPRLRVHYAYTFKRNYFSFVSIFNTN